MDKRVRIMIIREIGRCAPDGATSVSWVSPDGVVTPIGYEETDEEPLQRLFVNNGTARIRFETDSGRRMDYSIRFHSDGDLRAQPWV